MEEPVRARQRGAERSITLVLDGSPTRSRVEPRTSVPDDRREQFGLIAIGGSLTTTRRSHTAIGKGCGQGGCEARIVLMDGVRTVSCLSLTVQDDGREITTTGMGLGLARSGAALAGSP